MDIYHSQHADVPAHLFTIEDRYAAKVFQGIMPDSGAAKWSTAVLGQFHALRQHQTELKMDTTQAGRARVGFGPGKELLSLGAVTIHTVIGAIVFHIVDVPTPFLLCLDDMNRLGVYLDNISLELVQDDKRFPVAPKWGHLWFHLQGPEAVALFLTETELRHLHRRFNHPAVDRLAKQLEKAGHTDVDINALKTISEFCHYCQKHGPAPKRFKFTLKDDHEFNYEIFVNIFYLNGQPVLHVVDSATSFHAARFLPSMTAKDVWEVLRMCWLDTYLGPPDIITTDAGSNFAAQEFKDDAKIMGITCRQVPVEAHWAIGKVERAHALLRRAYDILAAEIGGFTTKEAVLQMAVKSINDIMGPDGLVPTLLVFGAYPRMTAESPPSTTTRRRAAAYDKATKELRSIQAKRQIQDALNTRNGPSTEAVKDLDLQDKVLVWREPGVWDGPFKIISMDDKNVIVNTVNGPQTFRQTQAKPYKRGPDTPDTVSTDIDTLNNTPTDINLPRLSQHDPPPPVIEDVMTRPKRGRPPGSTNKKKKGKKKDKRRKSKAELSDDSDSDFEPGYVYMTEDRDLGYTFETTFMSRKEELDAELAVKLRAEGKINLPGAPFEESDRIEVDALINQGAIRLVNRSDFEGQDITEFNSRFVHEVKNKLSDQPTEKTRLVAQGYDDAGKEQILTASPTITRLAQRAIVLVAASLTTHTDFVLYVRDITQAYTQSATDMQRTVLLRLPKELRHRFRPGTCILVVKPLYGIAEAGVHWWVTYQNHHKERLDMSTSTFDPCLLVSNPTATGFGLVGIQTDDTLILSSPSFKTAEYKAIEDAELRGKVPQGLTPKDPLDYNGCTIHMVGQMDGNGYLHIVQKGQGLKLETIDKTDKNRDHRYLEQRARGAYISAICQPEAAFDLSVAAQAQQPTDEDFDKLNKRLQWQIDNQDRGLRMVPLDLTTAKIMVFTDGSFANNKDMSSQIGFIMVVVNETMSTTYFDIIGNVLHYTSVKCKRVTRSVLASEIYGMMSGFDIGMATSSTFRQIADRLGLPPLPLVLCTDSRSLYEALIRLSTTDEKRLMIDVMALREAYERREISELRWIDGRDNPADAMTKATPNTALETLIDTNELRIRVEGYVDRPGTA